MISGRLAIHEQFRHGSNLGSIFLEWTPATIKRSRILRRGNEKLRETKLNLNCKNASGSERADRILLSKQSTLNEPVQESEGLVDVVGYRGLRNLMRFPSFGLRRVGQPPRREARRGKARSLWNKTSHRPFRKNLGGLASWRLGVLAAWRLGGLAAWRLGGFARAIPVRFRLRVQASFLRKKVVIPSKLIPSKRSVTPPSGTLV